MNTKINKDYSSPTFINKVLFFLLIAIIIVGILSQFIFFGADNESIIKYDELQIGIITYPWITAGAVMLFQSLNFPTEPITFTTYFPASVSILFSSIFFFIFIPFVFIFSISPALELFSKEKQKFRLFIQFPFLNFIISAAIILIFTISLIPQYFVINKSYDEIERLAIEQKEKDLTLTELNDLAFILRERWSVQQNNSGWYGYTNKDINVFKQKVANLLNPYIKNCKYIGKLEVKEITDSVISLMAIEKNKGIKYSLVITPVKHTVELLQ